MTTITPEYNARVSKSAQKFFASAGPAQTRLIVNRLTAGTANVGHFRSAFPVATRRACSDMKRVDGSSRRSLVEMFAEGHIATVAGRRVLIDAAKATL